MFSLRMLLAVVTLAAVYIAGFVFRTEWWRVSILTLTYLIFAGAITAAILSHQRRAFFVAFAVFGLAYALCVYVRVELVTERLLTSWARTIYQAEVDARRQEARDAANEPPPAEFDGPSYDRPRPRFANPFAEEMPPERSPFDDPVGATSQPRNPFGDFDDTLSQLRSIGHSFFALLVGFVTGVVAEAVVRRRSQSLSSAANASGPIQTTPRPS